MPIYADNARNVDPWQLTRTLYDAIHSYSVRVNGARRLKFSPARREGSLLPAVRATKPTCHAPSNICLGKGPTIMTMGASTATDANEGDLKLTIVNPQNLYDPTPNGYSTAVIVPGGARVAYISGQGGQDSTGALSPDFAVQVRQAYANLRTAIEALGAKPDQVAKLTVFVVDHDMSKLGVLTGAVKDMFGAALPAQTLVPVPKLAIDPMLFEVEAVVMLD
jgi:enamine deaminase RidA (YjgF/YER057c/UK114 family)